MIPRQVTKQEAAYYRQKGYFILYAPHTSSYKDLTDWIGMHVVDWLPWTRGHENRYMVTTKKTWDNYLQGNRGLVTGI